MKKTGLNGYVYDFSVDYDAIPVDDINEKEWHYIKCLDLLKNIFYNNDIFWLQCINCKSVKIGFNE